MTNVYLIVMKKSTCLLKFFVPLFLLFISCVEEKPENTNKHEQNEAQIVDGLILPTTPYEFKLYQRQILEIAVANSDPLTIYIGDITQGQTLLNLTQGKQELINQSIVQGEKVTFSISDSSYVIFCKEQVNLLIGEDYAYFVISHSYLDIDADNTGSEISLENIEHLITLVEQSDVIFIRNGNQHTPKEVADHLRTKWENSGNKNMTIEQFIENIASKSSISGNPYQVKLADGSVVTAKEWYSDLINKESL